MKPIRKHLIVLGLALAFLAYALALPSPSTYQPHEFSELDKRTIAIGKRGTKPDLIGNDASAEAAERNRRLDSGLLR